MAKPTTPTYPKAGMTGPADTDDPGVRVSSTPPNPTPVDIRSGTTRGATAAGQHQPAAPLRLLGEPRIERFETVTPAGRVVEVARNLDTGHADYTLTDRSRLGAG